MSLIPQSIRNVFGVLVTSANKATARWRVDLSQTGFWEGREFRIAEPINGTKVIKIIAPIDFILQWQSLVGYSGEIQMLAYRAEDGVESGTFTDSPYFFGNNLMSDTPTYVGQVKYQTGGGFTPTNALLYRDKLKVVVSNAVAQESNVGSSSVNERGLPANTYYLVFTGGGEGDFYSAIEERPDGLL